MLTLALVFSVLIPLGFDHILEVYVVIDFLLFILVYNYSEYITLYVAFSEKGKRTIFSVGLHFFFDWNWAKS